MIIFPQWLFAGLVYGALAATAAGLVTLLVLLVRDWRGGKLW